MSAPAITNPRCPKCGGPCWDQKAGKYPWKPGTPIFKCRDKENCDGVIWEQREHAASPKTANVKRPYNSGPALPGEFDGSEAEETDELNAKTGTSRAAAMLSLYRECFSEALRIVRAMNETQNTDIGFTSDNVCSITSTLFIESNKRSLVSLK